MIKLAVWMTEGRNSRLFLLLLQKECKYLSKICSPKAWGGQPRPLIASHPAMKQLIIQSRYPVCWNVVPRCPFGISTIGCRDHKTGSGRLLSLEDPHLQATE